MQRRSAGMILKAKKVVDDGLLGKITLARRQPWAPATSQKARDGPSPRALRHSRWREAHPAGSLHGFTPSEDVLQPELDDAAIGGGGDPTPC